MGRKERIAKARKAERQATEFNPPEWQPVSRPKPEKPEPQEEIEPPIVIEPGFRNFLDLPRELRDMVYDYLITPNPTCRIFHYPSSLHARSAKARRHAKEFRKTILQEREELTRRKYEQYCDKERRTHPNQYREPKPTVFHDALTGVQQSLFLVNDQVRCEVEDALYRNATFLNNLMAAESQPYAVLPPRSWLQIRRLELTFAFLDPMPRSYYDSWEWYEHLPLSSHARGIPAVFDLDKPRDCRRTRRCDVAAWDARVVYVLAMLRLRRLTVDIGHALVAHVNGDAGSWYRGYHVRRGMLVVLARLARALEERKAGGGEEVGLELVSRYVDDADSRRKSVETLVGELKAVLKEWELMACGCCFAKKGENGRILEID